MGARLGQHFLVSDGYRQRILDSLRLTGRENLLEIGPGKGALTDLLVEHVAKLIAVEIDPELAAEMREKYADIPKLTVIEGDILRVPLDNLPRPLRVFGNLPYYITSPILLRLFEHANLFEQIVVMVQQEVAERITATPGTRDYGFLSVTARYYTTAQAPPKLLFSIPPGAFHPAPKVYSAVVGMKIAPRHLDNEAAFFRMVKAAFSQKRKTITNNLKALYGVDRVKGALAELKLAPSARAEEMSLEEFEALFLLLGLA